MLEYIASHYIIFFFVSWSLSSHKNENSVEFYIIKFQNDGDTRVGFLKYDEYHIVR